MKSILFLDLSFERPITPNFYITFYSWQLIYYIASISDGCASPAFGKLPLGQRKSHLNSQVRSCLGMGCLLGTQPHCTGPQRKGVEVPEESLSCRSCLKGHIGTGQWLQEHRASPLRISTQRWPPLTQGPPLSLCKSTPCLSSVLSCWVNQRPHSRCEEVSPGRTVGLNFLDKLCPQISTNKEVLEASLKDVE